MARLVVHQDKIQDVGALVKMCPFSAIELINGEVTINGACRMCRICVKKGPSGAVEYLEDLVFQAADKSKWTGIAVYVDHTNNNIHPVTFELIGKAKELAGKISQPVYAIAIGSQMKDCCQELLHYGVDKVFLYDHADLSNFKIESYTNVMEDFINLMKPAAILVGATPVGRQLAPRVAVRMHTGLTADCTSLEIKENTDLVQIRPAFGGNIMAEIITPNHRPQMATVRYKVMNPPVRNYEKHGRIISLEVRDIMLENHVKVIKTAPKEREEYIEAVEILVVAGRGVKKPEDLKLLSELASCLKGQLACTRPIAEAGWMDAKRQVGLSGRTVRPKLIITCGVSGAIQFVAGMNNSDTIIAINKDPNAPIFKTSHYGLVGDLYEIIPELVKQINESGEIQLCRTNE